VQRHAPIQAAKAMGAINVDRTPANVAPIHPVIATAGVGDADGQLVLPAGLRRFGQIAFKRQLLHDRVAYQALVQMHLGAHPCAANLQQYALPLHADGNINLAPPPGDAAIASILRDRIAGGIAVFIGSVRKRSVALPEMLLDGGGKRDHRSVLRATVTLQHGPPTGRRIDRKLLQGKALRKVNQVFIPLCLLIDPQIPILVGQQLTIQGLLCCAAGCQQVSETLVFEGCCGQRAGGAAVLQELTSIHEQSFATRRDAL